MAFIFPPTSDRKRFPILSSPCDADLHFLLLGADGLIFSAPEDVAAADFLARQSGNEWHLYGDTRWGAAATWVEFPMTREIFGQVGVLVRCTPIPVSGEKAMDWISINHPFTKNSAASGAYQGATKLRSMLEQAATQAIHGPTDQSVAYLQSYDLFGKSHKGQCPTRFANYTDLLNKDGIPIPSFRLSDVRTESVAWCRQALNGLFHLNRARLSGTTFQSYSQRSDLSPKRIEPDRIPPKWFSFHPSRTLRARPAVKAMPRPQLIDGVMMVDDYEDTLEARRQETSLEQLAFEREIRSRDMVLTNLDTNSCLTAVVHRANGGAIYVLPDALVQEFDKTDCSEVRTGDIQLPFSTIFLKFTPPKNLRLRDDAPVDGCYVAKQGEEYLVTLTSRLEGIDYENSASLTSIDPIFSIHLPVSDLEMTINDAVEAGIMDFLSRNAPPEDDLSTVVKQPDGSLTQISDIRAISRKRRIEQFRSQEPAFRACLNIIVNAACFIAFREDDIEDAWEGEPPKEVISAAESIAETRKAKDRKESAVRRIENGDFTRIKICGLRLFSVDAEKSGTGLGNSPRAHWRRGHWRRQKYGSGLAQVALRWIRPTIVKKGNGDLIENRIYDIQP